MKRLSPLLLLSIAFGCSSKETSSPEFPTVFGSKESEASISVITEETASDGADGGDTGSSSQSVGQSGTYRETELEEESGQKINLDPSVTILAINPLDKSNPEVNIKFREQAMIQWQSKDVRDCKIVQVDSSGEEIDTDATGKSGEQLFTDLRETNRFRADCSTDTDGTISAEALVTVKGSWFQADEDVNDDKEPCDQFCINLGLINAKSSEGFMCTSGEAVAASAIGVISFKRGCWPDKDCPAHSNRRNTRSADEHCYGEDQKKDGDRTDRTMGCYCE